MRLIQVEIIFRKDEEIERLRAAYESGERWAPGADPAKKIGGSGRAKVGVEKSEFGIKHPYLGLIVFGKRHPLIVMRNLGTSIAEEIESNNLQLRWKSSPQLRLTFAKDVGESALNLVDSMMMCHNDIRAPNIVISDEGDLFCLVDFNLSAEQVLQEWARVLKHFRWKSSNPAMSMFLIAQISYWCFNLIPTRQTSMYHVRAAFGLKTILKAKRRTSRSLKIG